MNLRWDRILKLGAIGEREEMERSKKHKTGNPDIVHDNDNPVECSCNKPTKVK